MYPVEPQLAQSNTSKIHNNFAKLMESDNELYRSHMSLRIIDIIKSATSLAGIYCKYVI